MSTKAETISNPISESPDSPSVRWMNALVDLLNRHSALRPKGYEKRLYALRDLLWEVGCNNYVDWLLNRYPAPVNECPDAEIAALKAVEANMGLGFHSPADKGELTRDQQQELPRLIRSVIAAVKDRLRELEGDDGKPTHSADFTSVDWYGTPYKFTKGSQAESVRALWDAWEKGTPSLSQATIAENVGSANDRFRLEHVFKPTNKRTRKRETHPAWGKMIQRVGKGVFALFPARNRNR